jgi:cysteinyl-tRNA synthetase, unknown class
MRRIGLVLLIAAIFLPGISVAQTPGAVRAQGRDVVQDAPDIAPTGPVGANLDPREEMRRLVQGIAKFTRGYRRDFAVVPMDGLELLVKVDPTEPDIRLPARTYMKSISGVMQTGLYYGVPEFGKPTDEKRREILLPLLDRAKKNGLQILVMDYAREPKAIDAARRLAAKQGFVFFGAPAIGESLSALPRFPRRPYLENGDSVLSIKSVKNYMMLRDSSGFGRQEEFALQMHGTNFDLIIVDVFHSVGEPLTKRAIETLKYKKIGGRRLVYAFVDIGSAASYDYFWKPNWREGSPQWISAPTPGDPDRYFVQYWQPEWRQIIASDTNSYIYGLVAQGFDGVILGGIGNYRFFEGGLEALAEGP